METSKESILLVEDEPDIASVIRMTLQRVGLQAEIRASGEEGLERLQEGGISLMLLDIKLPGIDGYEVCRRMRMDAGLARIPIIMLTSMTEDTDIVVGFGMGADDYVRKPFSGPELVARVQAALRRARASSPVSPEKRRIACGTMEIDPVRHVLTIEAEPIALTLAEFRLLHFLMANQGQAFTRQQLLPKVVGEGVLVIDRNIDVHVRNLRKKLGRYASYIVTVRGIGYRFECPTEELSLT